MKKFLAVVVIAAMTLLGGSAFAYDVKVDDDTFAKIGTKAQIKVASTMPDKGSDEIDVTLPNTRIYFAGQVTSLVKFGFNYDFGTASARATDAFITLDFAKEIKVMTGIYRVAFSRIALQDSYQYILVNGPEVPNSVAPVSSGLGTYRNAGVSAWGDLVGGKLRYNVGVWDDEYSPAGAAVSDDKYMLSARVAFNFLDPEPGYTCAGCYLGKTKVASVGLGYLQQDYRAGADTKTATALTVDAFLELNGITAEAAYFMADDDSGTTGDKPSGVYVEGAYAIDNKIQPALRFETFDSDGDTTDYDKVTVGVNYLFDGQNAKVGLEYATKDFDKDLAAGGGTDTDTLSIQLQVQF